MKAQNPSQLLPQRTSLETSSSFALSRQPQPWNASMDSLKQPSDWPSRQLQTIESAPSNLLSSSKDSANLNGQNVSSSDHENLRLSGLSLNEREDSQSTGSTVKWVELKGMEGAYKNYKRSGLPGEDEHQQVSNQQLRFNSITPYFPEAGELQEQNNAYPQQKIMQQQKIQSPLIQLREVSQQEEENEEKKSQSPCNKQMKKDLKRKLELEMLRRESGITQEEFIKLGSIEDPLTQARQLRRKTRASSRQLQVKPLEIKIEKKDVKQETKENKSEILEESEIDEEAQIEEANQDSEFLPQSPGSGQLYEPKKQKGVPSFKKYDEVKSMLLDMHGFPWNYPVLLRKGIHLDQLFNQEMWWLSINAVYFPHNIMEVANSIQSPASFVNKFKSDKLVVTSKKLYEEEIVQKQIDLEVELEKNTNLMKDLGRSILNPDQAQDEEELEQAISVLQSRLEGEKKSTSQSFTNTIKKMQKCLQQGQEGQVVRLREEDLQAQAERELKSYSYHDASMLEEIHRLGKFQKENENNLLCDLNPKHPDAQRFFQFLEQKNRSPKIGGGAQFSEELKRAQHQKSSQRILMNRVDTSARELREVECSQSFTKHLRNQDLEVKTDKGFLPENGAEEENLRSDDVVCHICNDGDYEDDNMIVFCEQCNCSAHQRCYGIPEVPSDDWVCDKCNYLKQSEIDNIPNKMNVCPLCPFSAGLMKPTLIPKFTQKKVPEPVVFEKSKKKRKAGRQVPERSAGKVDYYNNYDQSRVKWMHLSCALFVPEVSFMDAQTKSPITGIDNIDPKRYKLTCCICKTKDGACVQCAKGKCQVSFHVECARQAKYRMEVKDVSEDNWQDLYAIYCEKHRPLEVIKSLQTMEKDQQTKITQFCKTLHKAKFEYLRCEALPRTRKE